MNLLQEKQAGIVMPIFSIDSPYGIGTFGKNAYDFIDWMKKNNIDILQILPINPLNKNMTSPFSTYSTLLGNTLFIDYDLLVKDGLIDEKDLPNKDYSSQVNYSKVIKDNDAILKKAYTKFKENIENYPDYDKFIKENDEWLEDEALFVAISKKYDADNFNKWPKDLLLRDEVALQKFKKENIDEINKIKFEQYLFNKQFSTFKKYANDKGIKLMGDSPINPSFYSSDVWKWQSKDVFELNYNKETGEIEQKYQSGVPGDSYNPDGQLWGNVPYNTKKPINAKEYILDKIKRLSKQFDIIKLDHFRGYEKYFVIPNEDKNAKRGKWVEFPGYEIFKEVNKEVPEATIVAENLGFLDPLVEKLRLALGYPGMKVYSDNAYPNEINEDEVYYIGTHDSKTSDEALNENRVFKMSPRRIFNKAFSSKAKIIMFTPSDLLGLGEEGRINRPGFIRDDNWSIKYKLEDLEKITWLGKDITRWKNRKLGSTVFSKFKVGLETLSSPTNDKLRIDSLFDSWKNKETSKEDKEKNDRKGEETDDKEL